MNELKMKNRCVPFFFRLLEIYWKLPIKRSPIRHMFHVLILGIGMVFVVRVFEGVVNPLPQLSDLNRFEGFIKQVEYLGHTRRGGSTTMITVTDGYKDITFKTHYISDHAQWLKKYLDQPAELLWRDELAIIRLSYLPTLWDLKVNGQYYTNLKGRKVGNYERRYKIEEGVQAFNNGAVMFLSIFIVYFLISNHLFYKRNIRKN